MPCERSTTSCSSANLWYVKEAPPICGWAFKGIDTGALVCVQHVSFAKQKSDVVAKVDGTFVPRPKRKQAGDAGTRRATCALWLFGTRNVVPHQHTELALTAFGGISSIRRKTSHQGSGAETREVVSATAASSGCCSCRARGYGRRQLFCTSKCTHAVSATANCGTTKQDFVRAKPARRDESRDVIYAFLPVCYFECRVVCVCVEGPFKDVPRHSSSFPACSLTSAFWSRHPGFQEVRLIPGKAGIAFVEYGDEFQSKSAMDLLQNFKITPTHLMQISFAKK